MESILMVQAADSMAIDPATSGLTASMHLNQSTYFNRFPVFGGEKQK